MPRDETYLLYILLAARRVEMYISGMSKLEFDIDLKTKDAVVLQIGNIGEAANKITEDYRKQHPEIKWHKMTGMRHRIFHQYNEIDWEIVWDAATRNVPDLIRQIESLTPPDQM